MTENEEKKIEKENQEVKKSGKLTKKTKAKTKEGKGRRVNRKKISETKTVIKKGRRKTAIARAVIREGKGRIRINKIDINAIENNYIKEMLTEPLMLIGDRATKIDIDVNVKGGGVMGQMQAARTAIAKGLVEYFEDDKLREKYFEYDKHFVVDDVRQVEPKKYKGPKARARYQKSYR